MPATGSTTRSKTKTQKSNTVPGTPVGSRTGTDGSSVQIPVWASTAKIDQLEDLSFDSSDGEQDDDQVVEIEDKTNEMADKDTPSATATSTASPLVERNGKVEAIVAKELSFSPTSSGKKPSPDRPAGRLPGAPVALLSSRGVYVTCLNVMIY